MKKFYKYQEFGVVDNGMHRRCYIVYAKNRYEADAEVNKIANLNHHIIFVTSTDNFPTTDPNDDTMRPPIILTHGECQSWLSDEDDTYWVSQDRKLTEMIFLKYIALGYFEGWSYVDDLENIDSPSDNDLKQSLEAEGYGKAITTY